jgi:hypothetical protein
MDGQCHSGRVCERLKCAQSKVRASNIPDRIQADLAYLFWWHSARRRREVRKNGTNDSLFVRSPFLTAYTKIRSRAGRILASAREERDITRGLPGPRAASSTV